MKDEGNKASNITRWKYHRNAGCVILLPLYTTSKWTLSKSFKSEPIREPERKHLAQRIKTNLSKSLP